MKSTRTVLGHLLVWLPLRLYRSLICLFLIPCYALALGCTYLYAPLIARSRAHGKIFVHDFECVNYIKFQPSVERADTWIIM